MVMTVVEVGEAAQSESQHPDLEPHRAPLNTVQMFLIIYKIEGLENLNISFSLT